MRLSAARVPSRWNRAASCSLRHPGTRCHQYGCPPRTVRSAAASGAREERGWSLRDCARTLARSLARYMLSLSVPYPIFNNRPETHQNLGCGSERLWDSWMPVTEVAQESRDRVGVPRNRAEYHLEPVVASRLNNLAIVSPWLDVRGLVAAALCTRMVCTAREKHADSNCGVSHVCTGRDNPVAVDTLGPYRGAATTRFAWAITVPARYDVSRRDGGRCTRFWVAPGPFPAHTTRLWDADCRVPATTVSCVSTGTSGSGLVLSGRSCGPDGSSRHRGRGSSRRYTFRPRRTHRGPSARVKCPPPSCNFGAAKATDLGVGA